MSNIIQTVDGSSFDLDSLEQNFTYNTDATVNTITVIYRTKTYIQSYTYVTGKVSKITAWILQ